MDEIAWEKDVAIVSNPYLLRPLVLVFLLAPAIVSGLVALGFWQQGDLAALWPVVGWMFALSGGLLLAGLLASLIFYGNQLRSRFSVSDRGFAVEVSDRNVRRVAWATLILGVLAGKPGSAGGGLLALSNNRQAGSWRGVADVRCDDRRETIVLRNGWRNLAILFCTPANYPAVKALVVAHVNSGAQVRKPLLPALLWTGLVIGAALPLFASSPPFGVSLLASMMLVSFAVATVWFLPVLAYAVLGILAWIGGELALKGEFGRATGDDWAKLAACLAGLVFLSWFSVHVLRGRYRPVLFGDALEAGED